RSKGAYKSGKQMRKDPYYRRTIEKADQFAAASKLVKWVYYRHLPRTARKHGLFGKLTGMANSLLQGGKSKEEVQEMLIAHCTTLSTGNPPQSMGANTPTAETLQPTRTNVQAQTLNKPAKQARYLSKWKVKANGRLQLPKQRAVVSSTYRDMKENKKPIGLQNSG
ncbi:MAG TPA: hypothetical protein VD794_05545, partial [Flavisolibacter sp.]|nr:hypothetical protein [Flavisolibacter sp.]